MIFPKEFRDFVSDMPDLSWPVVPGDVSGPGSPCGLTAPMPCLDEAETIAVCAEKARDLMESRNIADEILIADHGSPAARRRRVSIGGSEQNNFRDLNVFLDKPNEVCVWVTGSRFKGSIEPGAMPENLP